MIRGSIAQLEEHIPSKNKVASSILARASYLN